MQIITTRKNGVVILGIHGYFNAGDTQEFERVAKQQMDAGERRFVLNLNDLAYINSAGLCSILATAKKIKEQEGTFVVCALQGEALKVFEISGFTALFSIYPTEAAALKQV